MRGSAIYAPKFKVSITQGNSKDWGYDESGLLTEMFLNYKILYPENGLKRGLLQINLMIRQYGRVRVKNLKTILRTFSVFFKSEITEGVTNLCYPL